MKKKLSATIAMVLLSGVTVSAHRLNEYLQATIISVEKDRVQVSMRLIPGVAVSRMVLASIDTNRDGAISDAECRAYAELVFREVSLSLDGKRLAPRLTAAVFPKKEEMKEGLGEIHLEFSAELPTGRGNRTLVFENHHQSAISVYLMNCLMPRDQHIRIVAQNRNGNQSSYQLEYLQANVGLAPLSSRSVGFASIFRLGIHHIAECTDHLLFLLSLLLPAPLIAAGSRWAGLADVRQSARKIVKIVTAFTVGHSITLALAGFGLVHAPGRLTEVLIAISIFLSAVHALRPLFPGREAAIAAFFGLIHGLAFASTIGELGLARWERVTSILAFNLGIETMQLVVVAATMPSLVLLSRTPAYWSVRTGGALFAGFAAIGWIVERLLDMHSSVDLVVDHIAHQAVGIALILFLTSLICWSRRKVFAQPSRGAGLLSGQSLEGAQRT